jgi:hypothetical protein
MDVAFPSAPFSYHPSLFERHIHLPKLIPNLSPITGFSTISELGTKNNSRTLSRFGFTISTIFSRGQSSNATSPKDRTIIPYSCGGTVGTPHAGSETQLSTEGIWLAVVGAPNEGDPDFGARVRFPLVEDGVRADDDAGHDSRCGRELLGVIIVEVWRTRISHDFRR